jgi:hypothetical protein
VGRPMLLALLLPFAFCLMYAPLAMIFYFCFHDFYRRRNFSFAAGILNGIPVSSAPAEVF